jgi:tetratricopeptide (TPR) repeat protein
LLVGGLIAGCAVEHHATPATRPAAVSSRSDKAFLELDQIQPRVELNKPADTSAKRPPIEALHLYAQAADALTTGRRFTAINLLQDALKLDPKCFELTYALAKAHLIGRTSDEQSIAALEHAAQINPDHLELQADLGRQYLSRGDVENGLTHLRLAVQTSTYASDSPNAAMADLFLARALQDSGYDRAALEQYSKLLRRVQGRTFSLRSDPHLAFLITDRLYVDIGDLYARNGQFEEALAAYEPAARRDPSDFDLEARVVRMLSGLHRDEEAAQRAADAVVRFRASKASLDLLREVRPGNPAAELAKMHKIRPADTTLLFALIELLREDNRWAEAEGFLLEQAVRAPADFGVIRRWFFLRLEREDPQGAARLLIEALSAKSDLAPEIEDLWADAVSPARASHLRMSDVRDLPVLPFQAAAKELAIASVADVFNRDAVKEAALIRAVAIIPPFAPAFRARLSQIWHERDTAADDVERNKLTESLLAAAGADPALVNELRGLSQLYSNQPKPAAEFLAKSTSPAGVLSYAQALRTAGDTAKFEQVMWKLLSDAPSFDDAYATFYAYFSDAGSERQAERVLNTWLIADPFSTSARILQAARNFREGRLDAARDLIGKLLEERADDPTVIRSAYSFYSRTGKTDGLITTLEQNLHSHPGNIAALSALIDMLEEKNRIADARPLIDAARTALADDPEHLYRVAHLYTRIGLREANEETLQAVLQVDPESAPASNDLGYSWAERGQNLANAETLIRHAVLAEPKNASFLDSLGWVLYKRGKFSEARPNLERAAGDGSGADPVVLDHLGDVLYRLGDRDGAASHWQKAAERIKAAGALGREDFKELQAQLDRKSKQLKANEPVTVSPVVEDQQQAKN